MDIAAIVSTVQGPPGADLSGVRSAHTPAAQRKAVAVQFEAIMLRQLLSESVGTMMGGDDTPSGSVYGYLLTDTMAGKLAQGGGMGLSKMIEQQLTPSGNDASGNLTAGLSATAATKDSAFAKASADGLASPTR